MALTSEHDETWEVTVRPDRDREKPSLDFIATLLAKQTGLRMRFSPQKRKLAVIEGITARLTRYTANNGGNGILKFGASPSG
jgi:hypothetical protein